MGFIMITEDTELDITALGLRVGQYVQVIAVGGGGGGGGGAGGIYVPDAKQFNCWQINKVVMDFIYNNDPINNFFNIAELQGQDGTAGGDTKVDDYIIAKGGQPGRGGTFGDFIFNKNTPNSSYYNYGYVNNQFFNNSPGGAGGAGWEEEQGILGYGGNGGMGTKPSNWYFQSSTYYSFPILGGGGGGGGAAGQVVTKTIKLDKQILNITIGKGGVGGAGGLIYNGYYNFGLGGDYGTIYHNYNHYMNNMANGVDMSNFTYQGFNNGKPYGFTNAARYSGNGGNAGYGGYRGNTNMQGPTSGCAGDGGYGFGGGGGGGGGYSSVTALPANNTYGLNFGSGGGGGGGGAGYQIGELRRGVVKALSGTMGVWSYENWNTSGRYSTTNNGGGGRGGYTTEYNHLTGTPQGRAGYNLWNYNTQSYASSGQGVNGVVTLNNACVGNGVVLIMW